MGRVQMSLQMSKAANVEQGCKAVWCTGFGAGPPVSLIPHNLGLHSRGLRTHGSNSFISATFCMQSLDSLCKTESQGEQDRSRHSCAVVSLHGYPLSTVPSEFYLTLQPLTLQRIHCPEIISSATLWHVKIRHRFCAAAGDGGGGERGLVVGVGQPRRGEEKKQAQIKKKSHKRTKFIKMSCEVHI